MRADYLLQSHRGDMWVENSEFGLGDMHSTSDGQNPCQRTMHLSLVAPVHEGLGIDAKKWLIDSMSRL